MIVKQSPALDRQIEHIFKQNSTNRRVAIKDKNWNHHVKKLVVTEVGLEAFEFIDQYVTYAPSDIFLTATTTQFNIDKINCQRYKTIINLKRINDFMLLNKYLKSVNQKLPVGGIFISKVEVRAMRKNRILQKFLHPFNYVYYLRDMIATNILFKLKCTKSLYFYLTEGKDNVLTEAEAFKSLYTQGFEILEEKTIKNELYFVSRKIQ